MTLNDTVVYYISFQSCNTVDTDRHAIIMLNIRLLEKHEEITFDIPVVILENSLSFQQVRYNYVYQFLYRKNTQQEKGLLAWNGDNIWSKIYLRQQQELSSS